MRFGKNSCFFVEISTVHSEVTGSCHICDVRFPNGKKTRFLVDLGLFQERLYDGLNFNLPFDTSNVEFVLVTHNHTDHIGRLPMLAARNYNKPIFCTDITKALMSHSLNDTQCILSRACKSQKIAPIYSLNDIKKTLGLTKGIEYETLTKITENISVECVQNGHLLGADSIFVKISYSGCDPIYLFFSGDYSNQNAFFHVNPIPKYIRELPINIILESTYGLTSTNDVIPCFSDNIIDAISRNYTVICPVFSLGRTQEILLFLKNMQLNGKLSCSIPIYLDGKLAKTYTDFYIEHSYLFKPEAQDFIPKNLSYVDKNIRRNLIADNSCKIILTSSGMGTYGPAPVYIKGYIENENALIHFTGYAAEGTLARKLADTGENEKIEISKIQYVKKCHIKYTSEFSAHAKSDELVRLIKSFTNPKLVLLNHGNFDAKQNLKCLLSQVINPEKIMIEHPLCYHRIAPDYFEQKLYTTDSALITSKV